MWRANGAGEAYLYVPTSQASGFCTTNGTKCDWVAGISFMRGAWTFKTGVWTKVALTGMFCFNSNVFLVAKRCVLMGNMTVNCSENERSWRVEWHFTS